MNLVEQAARRLEELRKTGAEVSGELSDSSSTDSPGKRSAVPSTIERAVQRLGGSERRRTDLEDAPLPLPAEQLTRARSDGVVDLGDPVRREPKFEEVPRHGVLPAEAGPLFFADPGRPSPTVELDLGWLSSSGYLSPEQPESQIANEFRRIKRPLINARQGKGGTRVKDANRIMVTSSLAGEGKSFVALNLAISVAMERDSTVLLIDADTTRPSLSQLLGLSSTPGLLDLLTDRSLDVSSTIAKTNIDRLAFLPAGTQQPHATELLASEAMERVMQHLASRYADRILIFDAPPLLAAAEPAVLAGYMGQIVVVVEANRTTHKALQHALAAVEACPVVMTVLNKASGTEQTYPYAG